LTPKIKTKDIHDLGVGISTVFQIFGHVLFKGGTGPFHMAMTYYHLMLLDTRNTNIYGLGVGISAVFLNRYSGTSCLRGNGPPHMGITYIHSVQSDDP
jgi:hypothetical protein